MKPLQLTNKLAMATLVLLACSCDPDPCLDLYALDQLTAETQEWFLDESVGNQILTDKNGISQTLILGQTYANSHDNSVEDACGNTYGSFDFSIHYHTSISPLTFMVDIRGDAITENGFYLKIDTRNLQTGDHNV